MLCVGEDSKKSQNWTYLNTLPAQSGHQTSTNPNNPNNPNNSPSSNTPSDNPNNPNNPEHDYIGSGYEGKACIPPRLESHTAVVIDVINPSSRDNRGVIDNGDADIKREKREKRSGLLVYGGRTNPANALNGLYLIDTGLLGLLE